MAQRQVRKRLAGITTALGLAVLLAGPASTFGLGVPGVGSDSATSTVQGAVETTQQTAATTVSNVETTVQTTVQTTTAVPQAVTNQVQSTAGAVRPAPAAAAPVQQPVTKAAAPRKATTKTSAPAAAPPPAQRAAVPVREVGGRSATARSSRIVDGAKRARRGVTPGAGPRGEARPRRRSRSAPVASSCCRRFPPCST